MKTHRKWNVVLGAAILSPVLLFAQYQPVTPPASQTQPDMSGQQMPSSTSMQDSTATNGDIGQAMKDKMFLHKAAEGGMAEVQLGQLALQRAGSDDVKSFAQKMIDDHTKLNETMAPIADSLGVRMPKTINKKDQTEYDRLSSMSGNDFDMEYLAYMVKDHHKDLHEFREEAATTTDPTLRDAVNSAVKVIHEHTMIVDKLARAKGVPVPSRSDYQPVSAPNP
jgi:putative membrane protein